MLQIHTPAQANELVTIIQEMVLRGETPICLTGNASENGIIVYRENEENNSCIGRRGIVLADGSLIERNRL